MDRKQEVRVLRMGRPLAAFSMMALLYQSYQSYHVSQGTKVDKGRGWDIPIDDGDDGAG
jgi:hypothetical protein